MAAGLLLIGRIKNVDRPGLMPIVPTLVQNPSHFILIDAGANADSKPINLYQQAVLANFYTRRVLGIDSPRVGLINNGSEASKGNEVTKAAYQLLADEERINFIGNAGANHLLDGICDVAVADGFTGNAVLKTLEGSAKSFGRFETDDGGRFC